MQVILFRNILIITTILTLVSSISSQNTCLEKLELSQKQFEHGDFVRSLNSLKELEQNKNCFFSNSENEKLLVLIVRNLIELDRIEEIDPWYKKLFENNKYFKPKEEIIEEDFILHLNNHFALPKLDLSIGFGARLTFVERLKSYALYEKFDYLNSNYKSEAETSFGLSLGYMPSNNHRITLSTGVQRMSSERTFSGFEPIYNVLFEEEIKALSLGLNYNYQFNINHRFTISPLIGYQINHFTDIENSITISAPLYESNEFLRPRFDAFGNIEALNIQKKGMNRTSTRISFDHYLEFGIDLCYRINRFSLFFNSSFQYGFNNFIIPASRYENHQLIYEFYYVDEDYKLHFLTMQAGLRYNLKYIIK
tara:strand:+ start:2260 stop:3357 length:1098 start_codon:yes stop_codon:yes gene_type:complete